MKPTMSTVEYTSHISQISRRVCITDSISGNAEFERLWKFFEECKGVETTHLQPFEGIDRKWEKLIQEKDAQQVIHSRTPSASFHDTVSAVV